MKVIRKLLGGVILFIDRAFSPKPLTRPPEYQKKIDQITSRLMLYQFVGCPFCVKVRRVIKALNLKIEVRNVEENQGYKDELIKNGGILQVPCLRILNDDGSVQWMYESSDIIRYLRERFSE